VQQGSLPKAVSFKILNQIGHSKATRNHEMSSFMKGILHSQTPSHWRDKSRESQPIPTENSVYSFLLPLLLAPLD